MTHILYKNNIQTKNNTRTHSLNKNKTTQHTPIYSYILTKKEEEENY